MKKNNIWTVLGICIGALAIIFGFILLNMDCGHIASTTTAFGADFYTESYQASAKAVMNLYYLAKITKLGFGFLLISLGLSGICYFGYKATPNTHNSVSTPTTSSSVTDEPTASQAGEQSPEKEPNQ